MTQVAAVQLDATVADLDHNLAECERLADAAGAQGASWIILPEFFSTGMAYDARLADLALPPTGPAAGLLRALAQRHSAHVGGSFLCRDVDGEVRNAFLLYAPNGELIGRHDKDLPTMWENCFYTGGSDAGLLDAANLKIGVAMCWELIRTQTAARLRSQVDLVIGGSCWWSIPEWLPRTVSRAMESRNESNATSAAPRFARFVGAPVIHAAHCGPIHCPLPWTPLSYGGTAEGGAGIFSAEGKAVAYRSREEGSGVVVGEIELGPSPAADEVPNDYWLCDRGPIPELAWKYQRAHGRRWYSRQIQQVRPGRAADETGMRARCR